MSSDLLTFLMWLGATAVLVGVLFAVPKFVQSFDKMSAKKVEKYKHLLPA